QQPLALVTFGIVATYGHTGLGYIQRGEPIPIADAYRVLGFFEKPEKAMADRYVESGRYYWNSGMFVWRCDTMLTELEIFLAQSHPGFMRIGAAWPTPQREAVLHEVYPALKRISIDFAVMEKSAAGQGKAKVAVV